MENKNHTVEICDPPIRRQSAANPPSIRRQSAASCRQSAASCSVEMYNSTKNQIDSHDLIFYL
ncbi:MAG: hypothetical protein LBE18_05645 [Planctomycetaceae bacterium]|nr:hypothetical protein [Planctomycetaceae bacterium]